MGTFLGFPIHQPEYAMRLTRGLYDPFVVDVLGDAGEFMRGYVCDVNAHGLYVKLDGQTVQHIPFGRAWSVKEEEPEELPSRLNSGDIDVRIALRDGGVPSWTPAGLIDSVCCAGMEGNNSVSSCFQFSIATVEVIQPDSTPARYTIIDGPTAMTQRIRKRGCLGPLVPRDAFEKAHVLMFDASVQYPHSVRWLRTACSSPRFSDFWLRKTSGMLLSVHDEYVEVLLSPEYPKSVGKEDDGVDDERCCPVEKWIVDFVERLLIIQRSTVDQILNGLSCTVQHCKEIRDDEPCFCNLFLEIQVVVFSYLDIFHQNFIKRVSRTFLHLLNTSMIQSCAIVPTRPDYDTMNPDKGSVYSTWIWKGNFACAHYLARTVTNQCRTLYLCGKWEFCLFSMVELFNFLSLKLQWLVVTDNTELYIGELINFPQSSYYLDFIEPDVYKLFLYKPPEFATVCDNILLQNCEFDVKKCMNFPKICHAATGRVQHVLDAKLYFSYEDTFSISVIRWSFGFVGAAEADYAESVLHMFEVFCPELESSKLERLLDGLNAFPLPKHAPENLLWAFLRLSFMLWNSPSPGTISDIRAALLTESPQRKLITQTLYLLSFLQRFQ
ncbi:uncharacterized protein LOC129591114 [Paramacrobiotus metropolitanus]|uniref:uncharacterized protein LOC129591114 n=1 Tax=Paramacrobiotus metropolitanus TaxID=2943436 RepID=UPI0024462C90|nr:uncharacterized protein LOC129591114 [Paramacrobiotus metropolitanus]